ncbi:hypothetical protein RA27_22645 [Ruegeria sp. ANG-R]|nr:hypothetical protein RA27_22645 [Ruegeria sp. ANG-R]
MFSCLNLLLFQGPLLNFSLPLLDFGQSGDVLVFGTLELVQFTLLFLILLVLGILPVAVLKGICIAILLANSAALYFMSEYAVELDRTMIGNILNTDQSEAGQLWHPAMLLWVVGLGVIPSLAVAAIKVRRSGWLTYVATVFGTILLLATWLFYTSTTWFWFDAHAPRLGGRVLPWSYTVNTIRYLKQEASDNREFVLLPPAEIVTTPLDGRKQIVVLVIGEAARAKSFSHYGYDKDTNPYTRDASFVVFPPGQSCATYTIASVACILSHQGSSSPAKSGFEPLPSYLTRHGVETIWRSNNFGEPPLKVDTYARASEILAACDGQNCPETVDDAVLLNGLADQLNRSSADRIFVVLHQSGSHGPAYYSKYPPEFERFTPVCKTVQVASCTSEELQNAYDNSILFTDYLNASLVTELQGIQDADVAVIYVADHGQSLGENGLYLHGAPNAVAPDEQRQIPFLVWMSDSFKEARGLTDQAIVQDTTYPHDFVFHSVLGALGLRSEIYLPKFDIFHPLQRT